MKKARYKFIAFLQFSAFYIVALLFVSWYAIPHLKHKEVEVHKHLTADDYKRYRALAPDRHYYFKKTVTLIEEKSSIPFVFKRDTLRETAFHLMSKSR